MWPTVQTKKRGQPSYTKLSEAEMKNAREAFLKSAKQDNKRRREARLLEDDDDMDHSGPSNARGSQ